jgi:hypothetical protein
MALSQPWVALNYSGNVRDLSSLCIRTNTPFTEVDSFICVPRIKLDDFCAAGNLEYTNARASNRPGYDVVEVQIKETKELLQAPEATNSREAYVQFCLSRFGHLDRDLSGQLARIEARIAEQTAALTESYAERENLQEQVKIYEAQGVGGLASAELAQEFDNLLRSPKIARVDFDRHTGYMSVRTKKLRHRERSGTAEFVIKINLNPGQLVKDEHSAVTGVKGIFIEKVSGWDHPHYDEDWGSCATPYFCLGNAAGLAYDAMREYKLSLAIDVIIKYLEEG